MPSRFSGGIGSKFRPLIALKYKSLIEFTDSGKSNRILLQEILESEEKFMTHIECRLV